jgi:tRNA A-37 threonylcarbamoyl transferase component Bud32
MQAANSDELTTMRPSCCVGDRLKDRYEIIAHVGSGGMADVFHGWDELFCRDVAIKVLKPERLDEVMKRRVLREARASCAVDHPHMLRVTDMGLARGAPFLVTDLLRGTSLGEVLRRAPGGRLEWARVLRWMLPAMAALHAAHEACVVHRDIKPENLFLHHRGEAEVLMVLDLGIVKFTDLQGKPTRWTQSGIILGTAAYMAPEQAMGGPVDRRSDVYSLAVTLYRLIRGEHMFPLSSGACAIEAMTRHIYEPPPRLEDPSLPSALVDAVFKAVSKDPAHRQPTMAAFAAELAPCLDEPPGAAPARRRRREAACAGLGGVLGAGLALAGVQLVSPDPDREPEPPAQTSGVEPGPVSDGAQEVGDAAPGDPADVCMPPEGAAAADHEAASVAAPPGAPPTLRGRRSARATLDLATAAARRCVRMHDDPDTASLPVRIMVRADGRVGAIVVRDDPSASFLSDCLRAAFSRVRLAPDQPRTLEHTFRFKPTKESP